VAPLDDGLAIHYTAVQRGTPVYSSEETEVGKVVEVLDNYREHIFDGLVIEDRDGVRRFVDAPEVGRTAERGVTLTISAEEVAKLGPPEKGAAVTGPGSLGGVARRLFRRRR
jgi:hypothetical protein